MDFFSAVGWVSVKVWKTCVFALLWVSSCFQCHLLKWCEVFRRVKGAIFSPQSRSRRRWSNFTPKHCGFQYQSNVLNTLSHSSECEGVSKLLTRAVYKKKMKDTNVIVGDCSQSTIVFSQGQYLFIKLAIRLFVWTLKSMLLSYFPKYSTFSVTFAPFKWLNGIFIMYTFSHLLLDYGDI